MVIALAMLQYVFNKDKQRKRFKSDGDVQHLRDGSVEPSGLLFDFGC